MEQQDEIAAVRATLEGKDEIEYFDEAGVLSTDLRLAHGVWIPGGHLPRLAAARTSVVHCPSSNLKLGSGVAPVAEMRARGLTVSLGAVGSGIADVVGLRRAGIAVGVGADGAPCNNRLDALEEIRLAGLLQKLRHGPESFSGLDALRLATSDGARALGLDAEVGMVEPGKAADLLVLSLGDPAFLAAPEVDPHDLVAWSASRFAVRHVLVAGEILVEDGRLTHLDLEEIRRRAGEELAKLLRRSGLSV
jgi:5-methylthioadenosine/S-adenosylhomocysteine deaminase